MQRLAFLTLLVVLSVSALANGQCGSLCIFYGGDFDPNHPNANGLANESDAIVFGNPYGSATYQNFVSDYGAYIGGLFTNNLMDPSILVEATAKGHASAYWEIRKGVSEGNGGTLVASGTGIDTVTPTGRSGFGYTEYRNEVDDLDVELPEGTYWFAVVPQAANQRQGRSFNSNTFGLNSFGTQEINRQYWNSSFFGVNFTNANNGGVFPAFSSGVLTEWIPEPSSLILLGTGLLTVVGAVRRRMLRQPGKEGRL